MGNLSRNLSRHEITCQCGECGTDTIDYEVVKVFQGACDHFAKKMGITKAIANIHSGCRCPWYNGKEGGARGSFHVPGRAIDFDIVGVKTKELWDYLDSEYNNKYGIGLYDTFVHIDSRANKARW